MELNTTITGYHYKNVTGHQAGCGRLGQMILYDMSQSGSDCQAGGLLWRPDVRAGAVSAPTIVAGDDGAMAGVGGVAAGAGVVGV